MQSAFCKTLGVLIFNGAILAASSAHATSFENLMAYVYENDPSLIAQREQLKAVDETVSEAVSGFRPNVTAEYDRGRERTGFSDVPTVSGNDQVEELRLVQPIFNGGDTVARIDAARARVRAERAKLEATEQRVFLEAITAQADLIEKREILDYSQHNVDRLSSQRNATQSRFKGGELTQTDVSQSQARLARAQAELAQAQADEHISEANFIRATGALPQIDDLPPLPQELPATLAQAESTAMQNPALIEAQYREKAASNDIDQRKSSIWPSLSLQGSMRNEEGETSPGVDRMREDAITLNLSIPLYQGGGEYARVREAKDEYQKARYDTATINRQVLDSVRAAWQDYQMSQTVIHANEEAAKASEAALSGVRTENNSGTRSILDVLDAEQESYASRINLEKAQRNERISAYQLLAAEGKLNAQTLNLKVSQYDPKEHYKDVRYKAIGF